MPSITQYRVAAVAIASVLALSMFSADALAKSSHSRYRAAVMAGRVPPNLGAGPYYAPYAGDMSAYASRPFSRGNVIDNTAGWGDVGAR